MKINKLVVNNVGPFSFPSEIKFEPDFTVLTGANDSGKSSILHIINQCFLGKPIEEKDVNNYSRSTSTQAWTEDTSVEAQFSFYPDIKVNNQLINSPTFKRKQVSSINEINLHIQLAPKVYKRVVKVTSDTGEEIAYLGVDFLPTVLFFPNGDQIRTILKLSSVNETEKKFLDQVFGIDSISKLQSESQSALRPELRKGGEKISKMVSEFLGLENKFELIFDNEGVGTELKLYISIKDRFENETFVDLRGSGVQKLLNIFVNLYNFSKVYTNVLLLFDEPETALHADAQHRLRSYLEKLGTQDNIQIVYATHSPAMINPSKPQTVRLLRKTNIDERASVEIINSSKDENYSLVRSNLGITLADSLMIGKITVITEGITEVKCIPLLFQRAKEAKLIDYFDGFFSDVFFLNGQGDSLKKWCSLVKQQGSFPIIFIDGDKNKDQLDQINHNPVDLIQLPFGNEFEDLINREKYFLALERKIDGEKSKLNLLKNFSEFEQNNSYDFYKHLMFTKRVDRFLQEFFPDFKFRKHEIMYDAINLCTEKEIKFDSIIQLFNIINQHI